MACAKSALQGLGASMLRQIYAEVTKTNFLHPGNIFPKFFNNSQIYRFTKVTSMPEFFLPSQFAGILHTHNVTEQIPKSRDVSKKTDHKVLKKSTLNCSTQQHLLKTALCEQSV